MGDCMHLFERFRPWPIKRRWRCVGCGMVTRLYDGADRWATRPVHRHMTVAVRGYNTWPPLPVGYPRGASEAEGPTDG